MNYAAAQTQLAPIAAVRIRVPRAAPRAISYPESTVPSLDLDTPKGVSQSRPPPYFDLSFLHQPLQKDPSGLQPIARLR